MVIPTPAAPAILVTSVPGQEIVLANPLVDELPKKMSAQSVAHAIFRVFGIKSHL